MRAGVADYRPVIIAYHIRSHPEAVSYCSRPFATHPAPVWTARRAKDFWGDALFGDEDGGCAHRSGALGHIPGVRRSNGGIGRGRRGTSLPRKSPDT